jgi:tetratricopeptide (TPR) repeat protein
MAGKTPIIRRIEWLYTFPHLLLMAGLILLLWRIQFLYRFNLAVVYGALAYLTYSFGSKAILLKHHRSGIRLTKGHLFLEAISQFESSYTFLSKYSWIDKFRFIAMLDSSAISYREMALNNIAYSYIQLGDKAKAKEYYHRAVEEFPESEMAKSGLEHLE